MTNLPERPTGLRRLKHLVVVMMESRSFDHLLGGLKSRDRRIDGLRGDEINPDPSGASVGVEAAATYQGSLSPRPARSFLDVERQIFGEDESATRLATMQGFVKNYFGQRRDAAHARHVMHYFAPEKLPVLTTLATEFAVFNHWFASVPGAALCNHAFAHYGSSFGHVGMEPFYRKTRYKSIYERLHKAGRSARMYPFDTTSSLLEVRNLLRQPPKFFGTYDQFVADCRSGTLPDYAFVAPNYTDHQDSQGEPVLASDQDQDHHVLAGERFIASVYMAIRGNQAVWEETALLVVYSQHGGLYDHVPPPACPPDGFVADAAATGTRKPFHFDRLGVRVPAVLVSCQATGETDPLPTLKLTPF